MAVSPQQGYTCGLLPAHRSDEGAACSSCHIVGAGRRLSGACLPLASAQLRHGESSCLFLLGPPGCASTQDGTRSQQAVCVSLDLHKAGQSVAATAPQHLSQSLVTSAGSAAAWARLGDAQKLGACRGDICTQSMQHLAQAANGLDLASHPWEEGPAARHCPDLGLGEDCKRHVQASEMQSAHPVQLAARLWQGLLTAR